MVIKLKLNKETNFRLTEPFSAKDTEDIHLQFITQYDLSNSFVELKNGDIFGEYPCEKDFTVPDEFMVEGKVFINVKLFSNDKRLIKNWSFLPISIKMEDGELKIVDYVSDLEGRVAKLEKLHEEIY